MATTRFQSNIQILNTSNYHEYAPIRFNNLSDLIFDKVLWLKIQDKWIGKEIIKTFGNPLLENNVKYNREPDDDTLYWKIYHLFNEWTSGNQWYNIIPNSIIIEISQKELDILIQISNELISYDEYYKTHLECDNNEELNCDNNEEFDDILPEIICNLKNKMSGIGYFVKTQDTSTKKDYTPIPVYTPYDALVHILSSKQCNKSLKMSNINKTKYLLLSPWKNISADNEFRVFVIDDKIAGISQQNVNKISDVMINKWSCVAEDIYIGVEKLYDNIKNLLPYEYQYDQCCLDIWIEEIDGCIIANLIEINGRGLWGSSGSSLYCWKYDPPIAENRELLIRK